MSESRKFVLKETLLVLVGVLLLTAVMCGIYALIGKFRMAVVWSGLVGTVLSTANFFFMAMGATLAADKAQEDNVKGGKATVQTSYAVRMVALFVILFACAKSGLFDLIALVLPLAFARPVLSIGEFFRKSGDKSK